MKKLIKTAFIVMLLFLVIPDNLFAQGPPPWAPAHGYRAKTRHIYFPDQNFYYDVVEHNYIYLDGGHWSIRASLPKIFVGINLGSARQIELDYTGNTPYVYNQTHIVKYKAVKHKKGKHKKHK